MNDWVEQLRQMQSIERIYWDDDSDKYNPAIIYWVVFEDSDGNELRIGDSVRFHNYMREYNFVFLNIVLNRIFSENGIYCDYWYPFNIKSVLGLVNDARNLLKLKKLRRITEFEFKHVLHDLRRNKWHETRLFRRRKRNYIQFLQGDKSH